MSNEDETRPEGFYWVTATSGRLFVGHVDPKWPTLATLVPGRIVLRQNEMSVRGFKWGPRIPAPDEEGGQPVAETLGADAWKRSDYDGHPKQTFDEWMAP